jgi:hypothetical protein
LPADPVPVLSAPPLDVAGAPFVPVSCSLLLEPHATSATATTPQPTFRTRAGECMSTSAPRQSYCALQLPTAVIRRAERVRDD